MTLRTPIIAGGSDSAETFRLALGGLWVPASALNSRTGVTSVPVLTGTGNFTATVGPFTCVIDGTSNSLQGSYPVANDVATTVTIGAANTQARIDLISLQIQDNAYDSSGQQRGIFVVTAGTPSGSPVAPSTPANAIPLWTVPVGANATSITWASATAVFPYTAASGGMIPVRNSSDQPAVVNGAGLRYRLDVTAAAGATSPVEASPDGTTWTPVYTAPGAWTTFATAWSSQSSPQPALGNGTLTMKYTKIGRLVIVKMTLQTGSITTYGTSAWQFTLPFTAADATNCVGAANISAAPNTYTGIAGLISTTQAGFVFASNQYVSSTNPLTWASGQQLNATFSYESTT